MNKKGFTLLEVVATLVIFSAVMLMAGIANSVLIRSQRDIKDARDGADNFEFVIRGLVADVKASNGSFSVENDIIRIYNSNGTYSTFESRSGHLYVDDNKICPIKRWSVQEVNDALEIHVEVAGASPIYLTLYKSPQDGGSV